MPNPSPAAPIRSTIRHSRDRRSFAASRFPTCCSPAITRRSPSGGGNARAIARRHGGAEMRPIAAYATFALLIVALCAPLRAAGDNDKQLARVAGTVQYQAGSDPGFHAVFGKIDLSDEALAVTLAQSRAQVILPDSSSIDV